MWFAFLCISRFLKLYLTNNTEGWCLGLSMHCATKKQPTFFVCSVYLFFHFDILGAEGPIHSSSLKSASQEYFHDQNSQFSEHASKRSSLDVAQETETAARSKPHQGPGIVSSVEARGMLSFEDDSYTQPVYPPAIMRFENVKVTNDTITVYYGEDFQPPTSHKDLDLYDWSQIWNMSLPTKLVDPAASHRLEGLRYVPFWVCCLQYCWSRICDLCQ